MFKHGKEWVGIDKASDQLECTIEEVLEMIEKKELEGRRIDSVMYVTEESVYKKNGLNPNRRQTKGNRGRKPVVVSYEEAKDELGIEDEELYTLIKDGHLEKLEMEGGKFGVTKRSLKSHKEKIDTDPPQEKQKVLSYFIVASNLNCLVEDVEALVFEGKLVEAEFDDERVGITEESFIAYKNTLEVESASQKTEEETATEKAATDMGEELEGKKVISHIKAASILGISLDDVDQLGFDGTIEEAEMENGNIGVTEESVMRYKEIMDGTYASQKTEEESHDNEIQLGTDEISETGGNKPSIDDEDNHAGDIETEDKKEQEEASMEVQERSPEDEIDEIMEKLFPGAKRLDFDGIKALMEELKPALEAPKVEMVSMRRDDFKAAMAVTEMKAKLEVYESLAEFKRKEIA